MNKNKIKLIFTRLRDKNPYPRIELNFTSPFELLIAVMLSAQSTDLSVNKATKKLYSIANTPSKILTLGIESLKENIKNIGLFNKKAEYIIQICRFLVKQYNGEVPEDRDKLEALPGVGRKTANVVLNIAFGWVTIAVDTHVFRVSNRTGLAPGNNVKEVENKLLNIVPNIFKKNCHQWLILHGRYTCIARQPRCNTCIIKDICEYDMKNQIIKI